MSEAFATTEAAPGTEATLGISSGSAIIHQLGPGGQGAAGWQRLLYPRNTPAGTWRDQRWNLTTGGLVAQLGARGDFGARVESRVGWTRTVDLAVGAHLLRARFQMGPVSERPNGQAARARVFAILLPTFDVGFTQISPAWSELPAGGTVDLAIPISIPGRFVLQVGASCMLYRTPGVTPYCETIVGDLRVEDLHWPLPQHAAEAATDEPDDFDPENARVEPIGEAGPDDEWVTLQD